MDAWFNSSEIIASSSPNKGSKRPPFASNAAAYKIRSLDSTSINSDLITEALKNVTDSIESVNKAIIFTRDAEKQGKFVKELFSIYKGTHPRCTHAYIISEKGVDKLLKYFYSTKTDIPIDEIIYRIPAINMYSLFPALVNQNGSSSQIILE